MNREEPNYDRLSAIIDFTARLMGGLFSMGRDNLVYAIESAEEAERTWPTERPEDWAKIKEPLSCQLRTLRIMLDFHDQLDANSKLCQCEDVQVERVTKETMFDTARRVRSA